MTKFLHRCGVSTRPAFIPATMLVAVALLAIHPCALRAQCSNVATSLPLPMPQIGQPSVAAGAEHSLFVDIAGNVYASGRNNDGELGIVDANASPVPDQPTPVLIPGLTNVVAVAAGWNFSLALKSDGTVWAWGHNGLGQIGQGSTTPSQFSVPTLIPSLTNIVAIAAGTLSAMAIDSQGQAWAWGSNYEVILGINDTYEGPHPFPLPVAQQTALRSVALGDMHAVAVDISNNVWVWGSNGWSQLGPASIAAREPAPVMIPTSAFPTTQNDRTICRVTATAVSSFAVNASFNVWSWGGNNPTCKCYLGHCGPTYNETATPAFVRVSGTNTPKLGGIHFISGHGFGHTVMASGGNNTQNLWGKGSPVGAVDGTGSAGSTSQCAIQTPAGVNWLAGVSAGAEHVLGLETDAYGNLTGAVRSWGDNQWGQLGRGALCASPCAIAPANIPNFNLLTPPACLTMTNISPSAGLSAGGATVTITGSGFQSASWIAVWFNGVLATNINVISDTQLTCVVPQHQGGPLAANVVVGSSCGMQATGTYTYTNPISMTVTGITPSSGSSAGTSATLSGTGLGGSWIGIWVNGFPASNVNVISDTQVTCTIPPYTAGPLAATVFVAKPWGTGSTTFTYTSPTNVTVTGVTPISGASSGGYTATITGTNFLGGWTAVWFNGQPAPASSINVISNTQLTCTVPQRGSTPFNALVVVGKPWGQGFGSGLFTYY